MGVRIWRNVWEIVSGVVEAEIQGNDVVME